MNINEISEKLWCGTIKKFDHSLADHSLKIVVEVTENSVQKFYQLELFQVSNLELTCQHPDEKWDYVELTEINIEQSENYLKLKCDLWSSAKLLIFCKNIFLKELPEEK